MEILKAELRTTFKAGRDVAEKMVAMLPPGDVERKLRVALAEASKSEVDLELHTKLADAMLDGADALNDEAESEVSSVTEGYVWGVEAASETPSMIAAGLSRLDTSKFLCEDCVGPTAPMTVARRNYEDAVKAATARAEALGIRDATVRATVRGYKSVVERIETVRAAMTIQYQDARARMNDAHAAQGREKWLLMIGQIDAVFEGLATLVGNSAEIDTLSTEANLWNRKIVLSNAEVMVFQSAAERVYKLGLAMGGDVLFDAEAE